MNWQNDSYAIGSGDLAVVPGFRAEGFHALVGPGEPLAVPETGDGGDRPTVTICGSMRFFPLMIDVAAELTSKGAIVLMPYKGTAPKVPASATRSTPPDPDTPVRSRTAIDRLIARREIHVREKTLWRMLYETCARTEELLQLNIEDLDLAGRTAAVKSKGAKPRTRRRGAAHHEHVLENVYWDAGTARLLPRLIRDRTRGPVFLTHRRPGPGKYLGERDMCPDTRRARLSYDQARDLLDAATATDGPGTGWDLHELRHSGLTHLGEAGASLLELMAKSRHRKAENLRRYFKPSPQAVRELTSFLGQGAERRR